MLVSIVQIGTGRRWGLADKSGGGGFTQRIGMGGTEFTYGVCYFG